MKECLSRLTKVACWRNRTLKENGRTSTTSVIVSRKKINQLTKLRDLTNWFASVSVRDRENERKNYNFIPTSSEERAMLFEIKSSFPCWRKKKRMIKSKTNRSRRIILQIGKYAGGIFCLYLLTIAIGPLCGQAKNIANYFIYE